MPEYFSASVLIVINVPVGLDPQTALTEGPMRWRQNRKCERSPPTFIDQAHCPLKREKEAIVVFPEES